MMESLHRHQTTGVPVVYIWFGADAFPGYFEDAARVSARNNQVIVLAEQGQKFKKSMKHPNISYVDLKPYLDPSRDFFENQQEGHYQPWGWKEPYEARNLWRAFALKAWMASREEDAAQAQRSQQIFLADCDVAVLADVSQVYDQDYRGCDAALSLQNQTAESLYWVVWIGSGFLSHEILSDFMQFALQMYTPTYMPLLQLKKSQKPYVCDMTIWYLYAAAAGVFPDAKEKYSLPSVSARSSQLCDTLNPGRGSGGIFDHIHGYKQHGFQILEDGRASFSSNGKRIALHSLHFQGKDKRKTGAVLKSLLQQ
jgi:hypothetical protein